MCVCVCVWVVWGWGRWTRSFRFRKGMRFRNGGCSMCLTSVIVNWAWPEQKAKKAQQCLLVIGCYNNLSNSKTDVAMWSQSVWGAKESYVAINVRSSSNPPSVQRLLKKIKCCHAALNMTLQVTVDRIEESNSPHYLLEERPITRYADDTVKCIGPFSKRHVTYM